VPQSASINNPKEYVQQYWKSQGYKEAEGPIVLPDELLD
jgi:hypothetical protein